jgi:hypothetical protein
VFVVNIPGMLIGVVLVGVGTAGVVTSLRSDRDMGPIADWLRSKLRREPVDPEEEADGGFTPAAMAASAAIAADDETAFAFKGKVHTGSTIKSRALAFFWLVLVIGLVAVIIAGALYGVGELVNSVIQKFVSG